MKKSSNLVNIRKAFTRNQRFCIICTSVAFLAVGLMAYRIHIMQENFKAIYDHQAALYDQRERFYENLGDVVEELRVKEFDINRINAAIEAKQLTVEQNIDTSYQILLGKSSRTTNDELIEVKSTSKETEIFLVTKLGMCIRFRETDVRPTGRSSMGVIGMNLSDGDEIVGMQLDHQGDSLLIVSENGMGKRTYLDEFTVQKRGGKGIKCYKITEKTGDVVGVKAVDDEHEIMMITTEGIIIQLRMDDISTLGRITSGVKMINLDDNVKVARIAKVREKLSDGHHEIENIDDVVGEEDEEEDSLYNGSEGTGLHKEVQE